MEIPIWTVMKLTMVMIHLVRAACSSVVLLILPFVVLAKQPSAKVTLDEATRQAGYTLELGRIDLGIQPDSLVTATKAWVRRVKNYPDLPNHLRAISPVYSFTIQDEIDWLTIPLQLQYHLKG